MSNRLEPCAHPRVRSDDDPVDAIKKLTSVGAFVVSVDGTLAAYAVSLAGSDWVEWRVLDVASGEAHEDVVRWSKFGTAAWTHDNKGPSKNPLPGRFL